MSSITFAGLRTMLAGRTPARVVEPEASLAAVALILVPVSGDFEALFIRRAVFSGDPWSGHMALPGGRSDPGDADLLATTVRETLEETGIVLRSEELLGELDEFTPRTQSLPRIVVRPHVFALPRRPKVTLSAEVAESFWISIGELRKSRGQIDLDVTGSKLRFPAFVVGPNVVWGLTERIVSPFIDLLDTIS